MRFKELFKKHWMVLFVPFGIILDQITKFIARDTLVLGKTIWIIEDLFGWTLSYNYGAAWSFLSDATWLLTLFSVLMSAFFIYYYIKKADDIKPLYRVIVCFIITGAIGNLIDRAFAGKVTDFINFNFFILFDSSFPIFNVADMFVVGAMIGMIVVMIFDKDFDKAFTLKKEVKNNDSTNN